MRLGMPRTTARPVAHSPVIPVGPHRPVRSTLQGSMMSSPTSTTRAPRVRRRPWRSAPGRGSRAAWPTSRAAGTPVSPGTGAMVPGHARFPVRGHGRIPAARGARAGHLAWPSGRPRPMTAAGSSRPMVWTPCEGAQHAPCHPDDRRQQVGAARLTGDSVGSDHGISGHAAGADDQHCCCPGRARRQLSLMVASRIRGR